jgi:hypothetical protein
MSTKIYTGSKRVVVIYTIAKVIKLNCVCVFSADEANTIMFNIITK